MNYKEAEISLSCCIAGELALRGKYEAHQKTDDKGNKVYALSLLFDAGNLNLLDYIKAWQIEQNEEGFIIVRIIKDDTYNKAIEKDLINVFKYKNITINIVYVDDIAKTKRGKHKFIIQNYKK